MTFIRKSHKSQKIEIIFTPSTVPIMYKYMLQDVLMLTTGLVCVGKGHHQHVSQLHNYCCSMQICKARAGYVLLELVLACVLLA